MLAAGNFLGKKDAKNTVSVSTIEKLKFLNFNLGIKHRTENAKNYHASKNAIFVPTNPGLPHLVFDRFS